MELAVKDLTKVYDQKGLRCYSYKQGLVYIEVESKKYRPTDRLLKVVNLTSYSVRISGTTKLLKGQGGIREALTRYNSHINTQCKTPQTSA